MSQSSGIAFLSNDDFLYTVNLSTGAATLLGTIGGALGADTISISAVAIPEPSTTALLGAALLGSAVMFVRRRTRRA
ncbi:MAG: PEP-CTERM sorting domain-containing protein [Chthoniobacterales bacterium]|nr:PEP-CTERM sorting domain-containing protein [Chthoniobacterales bacterium]